MALRLHIDTAFDRILDRVGRSLRGSALCRHQKEKFFRLELLLLERLAEFELHIVRVVKPFQVHLYNVT